MDVWIVFAVVVGAIVVFAIERIPIEVGSLAIVVSLAATGVLSPEEAFAGFANDTVIFIFALLAMTQGLAATGVMQLVGRRAAAVGRFGEPALLALLMGMVAAFSSVASNTAVTAAFVPIATAAAARAGISPSRVLIPVAYSSMLGGTIFLFGTSTNLVVSEAMLGMGMPRLGFAELAVAGLPVTLISIGWILLTRGVLLPAREAKPEDPPLAHREFVTEAVLTRRSRFVGRPLAEITEGLALPVIGIIRNETWIPPRRGEQVRAEDRLILLGTRKDILRVKDLQGMLLHAELRLPAQARREPQLLLEALVPQHSPLVGRTLRAARFAERYGLLPLAVHRHPAIEGFHRPHLLRPVFEGRSLRNVRLAAGDVVLLSGPSDRLHELSDGAEMVPLGDIRYQRPRYRRAFLAVAIFAAVVVMAGMRVVPPSVAGLAGMLVMIATGCVEARSAFRVEWRVVLLIGSLLALGRAMEVSGAGDRVAQAIVPLAEVVGPRGLLLAVMVLTVALSAPMSNQAAALVVLPVAVHVAQRIGVDARPFAIATCLAASCSFITPLEPSCALVYGPGHYRFGDFVRAGTPIAVLMLALLTVLVPLFWPLE